ncbi:MAG: cryptochrome/photolyase family protein [Gaiellales bacterium]
MPADAPLQLVWFRRDLRIDDNPALAAAAERGPVACCFVLDPRIFRGPGAAGVRVRFMLQGIEDLDARLRSFGGGLHLRRGTSEREVARLASELGAAAVHACADDEPFARRRDEHAATLLAAQGMGLTLHHDQTAVPHRELRTAAGTPYRRYSAYARAARSRLGEHPPAELDLRGRLVAPPARTVLPELADLRVKAPASNDLAGGETAAVTRLDRWVGRGLGAYADRRGEIADPDATSRLSAYLKLGMISPRRTAAAAVAAGAKTWLAELLWRDWFKYLLHHHPGLADRTLDPGLERLEWADDDDAFAAWTRGETGYGLVDAGMRQLAQTGEQPNRVRMVCASFLTRDLHLDWRRGELWFREHLVDGDLSANAGNWQWVAGTGIDAAPWFRVMSPLLQERRFDPDGAYVARWAPDRPAPIVDHAVERERALDRYRRARAAAVTPR